MHASIYYYIDVQMWSNWDEIKGLNSLKRSFAHTYIRRWHVYSSLSYTRRILKHIQLLNFVLCFVFFLYIFCGLRVSCILMWMYFCVSVYALMRVSSRRNVNLWPKKKVSVKFSNSSTPDIGRTRIFIQPLFTGVFPAQKKLCFSEHLYTLTCGQRCIQSGIKIDLN